MDKMTILAIACINDVTGRTLQLCDQYHKIISQSHRQIDRASFILI